MATQLTSAIIMAVISALAFIAYRHPKGYAKMYWPLYFTVLGCTALWVAFQLGFTAGFSASTIGYLTLNREESLHSPEAHEVPWWTWELPVLFMFYLQFLKLLPRILDLPADDIKDDKPKQKMSEKDSDDDT